MTTSDFDNSIIEAGKYRRLTDVNMAKHPLSQSIDELTCWLYKNSQSTLDQKLCHVCEEVTKSLRLDHVSLWLISGGEGLDGYAYVLNDNKFSKETCTPSESWSEYQQCIIEKKVLVNNDVIASGFENEDDLEFCKRWNIRASVDVALSAVDGELLGMLLAANIGHIREWTDEEIEYIRDISFIVSLSIGDEFNSRSNHALRESEERVDAVINNLPGVIYKCKNNYSWDMKYVSVGVYDLIGYSVEEFINGVDYIDYIDEYELKEQWQKCQQSLANDEIIETYYYITTKEGDRKWVADRFKGVKNVLGVVTEIEGMLIDLTDLKRAEEELIESQRKTKTIIDNIPGLVYRCKNTVGWQDEYVSEGIYELVGYSVDEMLNGTGIMNYESNDFINKADWEKVQDELKADKVLEQSYYIKTKTGERKWLFDRFRGIKNQQGEVTHVEGILMDYTMLKKSEDELKETQQALRLVNEGLEEQVKLRTRELAVALKGAEEGARAKAQFMANMSHEIRTPMNGVLGMLDLLRDAKLKDEERDFLKTAYLSAENLLTIIDDILDFSKIESGKMELEIIEFNIIDAVEDVIRVVSNSAKEKGLELILDIDPSLPEFIRGDPTRLRQVMINMVGNAVKFTEIGHIILRLQLLMDDDGTEICHCSVVDTGEGISIEAQAKIFDSFSQAEADTSRRFGGTGLGLAISKQLVTLMNGQVGVNSEFGKGSEFWFSMPFERSEKTHNEAIVYKPLENIYALLIDDHDITRPIFEKMLLAKNIKLDLAMDTESVLNNLEQADAQGDMYDILIVNLSMTSKNGLSITDRLKADERFKTLPIVLLSAETQYINRKEAVKHGIDIFLTKPARFNLIYSSLLTIVGYRSLPDQPKDIDNLIPRLEKILIAEDNIVNQKVISKMLLKLGFNGHVVDNGREAVQAVKKQAYDLIFMDMQMPELDGIAATKEIRNLKNHNAQKVPIIALTANVMESDKQACFVAGMSEFIMKPIKVVTLRKVIEQFLPVS